MIGSCEANDNKTLKKQYDLVVLCHDVDRCIDHNGKAANQILDPVVDQLEKRVYMSSGSLIRLKPRWGKSTIIIGSYKLVNIYSFISDFSHAY